MKNSRLVHASQESAASNSASNGQDNLKQSGKSNGMTTPPASLLNTGPTSPDTKTSETLFDLNPLTSSVVDTPANHFQWQEAGKGKMTHAISGQNSLDLFAIYDQNLHSWKMLQDTFPWDSDELSGTWPKSGTMQNGKCYLQDSLEPSIYDEGFSYWATPRSTPWMSMALEKIQKYLGRDFGNSNLEDQVTIKLLQMNKNLNGLFMNPEWGEWLMGFPIGWSDLNAVETPSSHKLPRG